MEIPAEGMDGAPLPASASQPRLWVATMTDTANVVGKDVGAPGQALKPGMCACAVRCRPPGCTPPGQGGYRTGTSSQDRALSGILCTPITEAPVVREGQAEAGGLSPGNLSKVREAWSGPLEQKGWEPSWEGLAPADQVEPPAARPPFHLCTPSCWSSLCWVCGSSRWAGRKRKGVSVGSLD